MEGFGALQFSSVRKTGQAVTDADLREFADEDLNGREARDVSLGDFVGITLDFAQAGVYWRKWWLRSGSVLLFVTYNCDSGEEAWEAATVDTILGSLRALGGS